MPLPSAVSRSRMCSRTNGALKSHAWRRSWPVPQHQVLVSMAIKCDWGVTFSMARWGLLRTLWELAPMSSSSSSMLSPSSSKWTCGIVLISRRGNHLVHASTDVTGPSKFMRAIRKRRPEAHTISCGMGWRLLIESTGALMGPCAAQQCDHLLSWSSRRHCESSSTATTNYLLMSSWTHDLFCDFGHGNWVEHLYNCSSKE